MLAFVSKFLKRVQHDWLDTEKADTNHIVIILFMGWFGYCELYELVLGLAKSIGSIA